MKRALYLPGPSYFDLRVKQAAGWWQILEYQREALEMAGYEVEVAAPVAEVYQDSPPVAKYFSYCLPYVQRAREVDLIVGAPAYACLPFLTETRAKKVAYVWNNASWWRRQQLTQEYAFFKHVYPEDRTSEEVNTAALNACDKVIACSPWVKKTHDKIVDPKKVVIAPWGVDSKMFTPGRIDSDGHLKVLFVGGDPIRKGVSYLVTALHHVDRVDVEVVGCDFVVPSSLAGRMTMTGPVPWQSMPSYMQRNQVICIPTLEDGICCAIQEGMASGLVPITSPDAGEVFVHRSDGFVVGFRDIDGIESALKLLRDYPEERKKMSMRARRRAEEQTWGSFKQVFAEQVEEFS